MVAEEVEEKDPMKMKKGGNADKGMGADYLESAKKAVGDLTGQKGGSRRRKMRKSGKTLRRKKMTMKQRQQQQRQQQQRQQRRRR
jgi:hypothetical protein